MTHAARGNVAQAADLLTFDAVTTVAGDLGYESVSAFIAMFRRMVGTTPARYFDGLSMAPAAEEVPDNVVRIDRPKRPRV